eukprot:Sdes_comp13170_c0_seq1m3078
MDRVKTFLAGASGASNGDAAPLVAKVAILTRLLPTTLANQKGSVYDNIAEMKKCIKFETRPIPALQTGQLLVKVANSTINPSDLGYIHGIYGSPRNKPTVPYPLGFEGSGVVVASGGGVTALGKNGKNVGFIAMQGGAWADYVVVDAINTVVLPPETPLTAGTACFVNPLTVLSFVDIARSGGHKYLVHTAAASALGRMLIRECDANGIRVICVVRRPEQIDICRKEGAQFFVDTSDANWQTQLKEMCSEYHCRLAFDAVSGSLPGQICDCLDDNGEVFVYGGLSHENVSNVSTLDLIFSNKSIKGFWLTKYLKERFVGKLLLWTRKVSRSVATDLKTEFSARYSLEQLFDAIKFYSSNMSKGKVLIQPYTN